MIYLNSKNQINQKINNQTIMNKLKGVLRITWCSFVLVIYSLFRSETYDVNEQIKEKLIELLFLSGLHFVTELCSILTNSIYSCLEAVILKLWYLAWCITSCIAIAKNQVINDFCTSVVFGHLLVYTLIFITHIMALIHLYIYPSNTDNTDNITNDSNINEQNDLKEKLVEDASVNP